MRAAVYRARREIAVEERPVPEPGPDEVLIEVSHCGICGTDLHMVLEGMGRPDSVGGHEYAGRIAAVGSQVHDWRPGDAVVGGPRPACGRCAACEARRPSLCASRGSADGGGFEGAFAEYVRVLAAQLFRVPDGLPLRVAALAEPLAVALHAITRSGAEPGARVLVTGAGPIGLLVVAALRAEGIDDVSVSEPAPARRERAAGVGAAAVKGPDDFESRVMPFDVVEAPFDVAIECSGNPGAMESALGQLGRGGTLVLVGTGIRRPKLDHNRILLNELVVTGAYEYDADGIGNALALLAGGRLPTHLLIEPEDVPLEGLFAALEALEAGARGGKVMVAPGEAA